MFLQPYKSDLIISVIKYVESHEAISNWTVMINSKVRNKHNYKYIRIKTILSIWYLKHNRFPYGRLLKQQSRLCSHG